MDRDNRNCGTRDDGWSAPTISLLLIEIKLTASSIRKENKGAKLIGTHIISGVPGSVDEQSELCRLRLTEIRDELVEAVGEKKRYLLAARNRWRGKLQIVYSQSKGQQRRNVIAILMELGAFHTEKDY